MKRISFYLLASTFFFSCNQKGTTKSSSSDSTNVKTNTASLVQESLPYKADVPDANMQIKLALLAAPPEKRDSATVYGYDADSNLAVIRKGTNEMICLADDPRDTGFSVACYTKELEPLMERGRDLRRQGMSGKQLFDERGKEVNEGTLKMPKTPATLYVYSASEKDVNHSTGDVKNGYLRYVIYVPFATAASTGLPEKPSAPGMPWLMDPGTYHAHVMIDP